MLTFSLECSNTVTGAPQVMADLTLNRAVKAHARGDGRLWNWERPRPARPGSNYMGFVCFEGSASVGKSAEGGTP